MSWWGGIDAEFKCSSEVVDLERTIKRELEEREPHAPTGSEGGPEVRRAEDGTVHVGGRLRDVTDVEDSPMVLAWFTRHARWCDEASLEWELDAGPRYTFLWRNGQLERVRGVLDL